MERLFLLFWLLLPLSGFSHHGNFTYDGSTVVTLEGEVLAFNWRNPHGSVLIRTDKGEKVEIETDGPSLIQPMGVTPDSLQPGDNIVAYVSPSNRGRRNEYLGREFIREDGSLVPVSVAYARRQESSMPPVANSLLGTWVPDRSNLFAFVASSENWALTAAGQASFDAYDTSRPFAQTNCIAATTPTLMMYPTANVLREVNGQLEINADWMGARRTVYMDGRMHPPASERFYQGHAIGHWEEDALIIETTNFDANPIGNVFSIASGTGKKVVERIELNESGSSATYSFVLTDPEYLAEPVTGSYQWHYRPDIRVSSVPCDPETASRYLQD